MALESTAQTPHEWLQITAFLELIEEMFGRSDYLLPLAAGQRQFRQDNYQMASAAQLEDLFFDAFGMYLRENHPSHVLRRRLGAELWDYAFDGLELSHKEAIGRGISVWWTAGDSVDGSWVPKSGMETYTSPHPIVLVYSGQESMPYTTPAAAFGTDALIVEDSVRAGTLLGTLGTLAIAKKGEKSKDHTLVLAAPAGPSSLEVERVWPTSEWADVDFFDLWPFLGGSDLARRDLWIDKKAPADGRTGLSSVAKLSEGTVLTFNKEHLVPGVYVLSTDLLTDAPTVANNRAHSLDQAFIDASMAVARSRGQFRPFPTWFAHFAESAPPNLYVQQRAQYEKIFSARQRT